MSEPSVQPRAVVVSMAAGLVLVAAAMIVPVAFDLNVKVNWPPLHAWWEPHFQWWRSLPAIVIGVALVLWLPRFALRARWGVVLLGSYAAIWAWTVALATSSGTLGIARVFGRRGEYLHDARGVTDVNAMVHDFIAHIPAKVEPHWHTHVAGHPVGAFLFFVGVDRLGITDPYWVGLLVLTLGCSALVAALITVRALGTEEIARAAVPWMVLAPWVIWLGVSADAMFTAVAAWGLCLLAIAATRKRLRPVWAVTAGVVLGSTIFLSYGLVLLGVLALAVLYLAGSWRPLPWTVAGAVLVVFGFAIWGFAWWEAYPVLHERYYAGIASQRPYAYWVWADIAAWTFSAGLAVWAALPALRQGLRSPDRGRRAIAVLAAAGLATMLLAALSGMSKAEVERIWLPFTLWVLALPSLLPKSWHRPLLASQALLALALQQLLLTRW